MVSIQSLLNSEELLPQEEFCDEKTLFMRDLNNFLMRIGKPIMKTPIMGYKKLDLFQLYQVVLSYGGYEQATRKVGTWSKIWKHLDNFDPSITDASFRLKKNYERFLLDWECQSVRPTKLNGQFSPIPPENKMKIKKTKGLKAKDVPRDPNGNLSYPFVLNEVTIHNLGRIIPKEPFLSSKHVWPVGFKSSRLFYSMKDPSKRVEYFSEILENNGTVQFKVSASDDPENPIYGANPSDAWRLILQKVSGDCNKNIAVSGALRFGLAHPTVLKLLKELPNADYSSFLGKKRKKDAIDDDEMIDYSKRKTAHIRRSDYNKHFRSPRFIKVDVLPNLDHEATTEWGSHPSFGEIKFSQTVY